MNVALLTDRYITGGGLEHMYQLCAGMPELRFGVFGKPGEASDKFDGLANVEVFHDYGQAELESFGPDLVHYHHLRPLLALRRPRAPTLFTVHGVHLHKFEFRRGAGAALARFARLSLERALYRRIDRFITVSGEDRAFLSQHYGVHGAATIYNGIDFGRVRAAAGPRPDLRRALGLPLDKTLYLNVARFDFPKGQDVLVRAVAELERQGRADDKVFVLAGDGALLAETRALAQGLGVSGRILFLGRRTDVYALMAAADVFVLPSRWEGLPITLIEALVAGLPAVASRTYGIATVQRETGGNVALFENENPADLARALDAPPSFTPCDLDMFSLERMVAATREIYLGR